MENQEKQAEKGLIYKIKLLDNKIYIGRTTKSLEERLRQHVYQATSRKKRKRPTVELPFVSPYRNYKGKDSSILRLITHSREAKRLKALPLREQRQWLRDELLKRTEILEVVDDCVSGKKFRDPVKDVVDRSNPLAVAERRHIENAWVEDPKQLLNYNSLPVHSEMKQHLFKAMNESIEILGNCGYSNETGKYYLLWDWEFVELTEEQQTTWDKVKEELRIARQADYDSWSDAEKAEDAACDFSDPFEAEPRNQVVV